MKELYELETEYIECDCHTELLQLTYEPPDSDSDIDFLYMSFYEYGHFRDNRFRWKDRLRHIWYILRHGAPWSDSIVLRTPERLKLMQYLKNIEKKRKNKK